MISSIIRSQVDFETKSATISETEQVSETITSSEAQDAQQIEMLLEREITSSRNLNMNDDSDEYERLLTIKKKIEQTKEIRLLRELKNQEWFAIFILFIHFKKIEEFKIESISINVKNLIMKQKKYLNIIKLKMYKKNSSQKLNIFVRACQIVFTCDRWFIKTTFIESILSNFCWATMFQNSIEFDKNIDCDSMKQRNSFLFENSFATFWKNKWARRSFK